MEKICGACKEPKDVSEFTKNRGRGDGLQQYCRACWSVYNKGWYRRHAEELRAKTQAYYLAHAEERKAYARTYHAEHRDATLHDMKQRNQRMKFAALEAYGGQRCSCCGETEVAFLTIDHIDGCTAETRKVQGLGTRFYYWLRRNGYPSGFQVLCFNCNLGRRIHGGTCPHQK